MKKLLFYIGRRFNPQLSKPYYIAYGQMSKKDAKKANETSYGSIYIDSYNTKEEYDLVITDITSKGFNISYR